MSKTFYFCASGLFPLALVKTAEQKSPLGPVAKTLRFQNRGPRVRSLMRELDPVGGNERSRTPQLKTEDPPALQLKPGAAKQTDIV